MNAESAPQSVVSASEISGDEAAEIADYRAPSALAIAGLLVGLAAPLCFFGPVLLVVPLVGSVVSFVALRRIAGSDGALLGRTAALAGLVLSLLSGSAAISHAAVTRHLRVKQAAELGGPWIELLLAGRVEEAFRLTSFGIHYDPAPDEAPRPDDPHKMFLADPVVNFLIKLGADAEVHLEDTVGFAEEGRGRFAVRQQYRVLPAKSAAGDGLANSQPVIVLLTIVREKLAGEARFAWLVSSIDGGHAQAPR